MKTSKIIKIVTEEFKASGNLMEKIDVVVYIDGNEEDFIICSIDKPDPGDFDKFKKDISKQINKKIRWSLHNQKL